MGAPRRSRRGTARSALAAAVAALLVVGVPGPGARADELAEARAQVADAARDLAAQQPGVQRALRDYDRALGDLAAGVSRSIDAERTADDAARAEAAAQAEEDQRVRALYMTGGAALYASVLTAGSATDALRRITYVQRLVSAGRAATDRSADVTRRLTARASRLAEAAAARVVRAADVERRYAVLRDRLARATDRLSRLSERARRLQEAQDLLAQVSALNAAVAAAASARVSSAHAGSVPPLFSRLYHAAARTCRGMSWTLLAAIGQVESGHGANPGTSYAGAQGPMQFMPATFASYGVDGDGDGDRDIMDPADAIFSAANYLCRNGAGRNPESTARAVWHYNHADWYVALVLKLAGEYADRDGSGGSALGGGDTLGS